jgi:small-conductance mechanosensitive channel
MVVQMSTETLVDLLRTALYIVGALLAGYLIRYFLTFYVVKWAQRTETKIDDIILHAVKTPLVVAFLIGGISFALSQSALLPESVRAGIPIVANILLILLGALVAIRIAVGLLAYYGETRPAMKSMTPIFGKVFKMLIYFVTLILILNSLGINVTALVAGLGIAGIAIAFALQETLAQFFAGLYIMSDRPVRVGDYVKIEGGPEGYVVDIGWRSTKIRELPNNIVVVPNAKLADSIVTNYYLPQPELSVLVQVGVSYDSDLEKVERVTIETAREVLKRVQGGVAEFEPFIRYHTFDDFSINFTVILRAREYVDRYLLTHEFIKALHKRYKEEGIEIPFPIRTVILKEGRRPPATSSEKS